MAKEDQGYTQEQVEEMTEIMVGGAFPDMTEGQVKEIAQNTGEQFMEEESENSFVPTDGKQCPSDFTLEGFTRPSKYGSRNAPIFFNKSVDKFRFFD